MVGTAAVLTNKIAAAMISRARFTVVFLLV
jgi:hypothetical protein